MSHDIVKGFLGQWGHLMGGVGQFLGTAPLVRPVAGWVFRIVSLICCTFMGCEIEFAIPGARATERAKAVGEGRERAIHTHRWFG